MPKVATPKQTGHGGPEFEGKVAAYLLACLLNQTNPFGKTGHITKIDFQVRADGWLFDDILLEINLEGSISKTAISVKTTPQFNNNGCVEELNKLLWDQYLHRTSSVFNLANDYMCVIESPLSANISRDLNTLLSQAKVQDPKEWQQRLNTPGYSSKTKLKLYNSFECPEKLKETSDFEEHYPGEILSFFVHVEMDFERDTSSYESRALDLCRTLLINKDITEAKRLFERLNQIADSFIKDNGSLDLPTLLMLAKTGFKIESIPNYKTDWNKLDKQTFDRLSVVYDKLGQKISIDRTKYVNEIENKLKHKPICIIQGISGSGKTVLAKDFAFSKKDNSKIIWISADDLYKKIEGDFQLENDLSDLMQCVVSNEAFLIIDGAEKVYHDRQKQNLALIVSNALYRSSCWKVIFTCPNEDLDFVTSVLYKHNINIDLIDKVSMPSIEEDGFSEVLDNFPQLTPFLLQRPLLKILSNLKLLDKLLYNIENIASLSQIGDIGETHLIDFIWETEIENTNHGIEKASFMKSVAEKQADELLVGVSTSNFDSSNIGTADYLRQEGFIRIKQQIIFFTHDLYGDWARYQLLVSHTSKLTTFLAGKHLSSSLWTRAIRLYGISLLEKDISGKNWLKIFEQFNKDSPQSIIIQNHLLEAFYFSPNSNVLLTHQRDLLFKDSGKLFKKIIKLFLISATLSNPQVIKIAKEHGGFTESEAAVYERIPIIQYWPDVLNFIHDHLEECLQLDLVNVAQIANTWLSKSPLNFIFRKEAADISLKAAQFIFSEQSKGRYIENKILETIYTGLLLGYGENEIEVSELCLKICKRKENPEKEIKQIAVSKEVRVMDLLPYTKMEAKQWPDGPFEAVDNTFQKLCLETNSILSLISLNPDLAAEVLLAVLIDEPHDHYLGSRSGGRDENYAIHNTIGWYPPFFLRGPFLNFLRAHPLKGIDFVVKITNHATNLWIEHNKQSNESGISITLNYNSEPKIFYGDRGVYKWCFSSTRELYSLVSILMAFEKFLFEEIDSTKSIENYIQHAMKETNSLAILAILIEAAKLEPKLFLTELKCILPEYRFYSWDWQINQFDKFPTSYDWSKKWKEEAEKFANRKSLVNSLKYTLIGQFLENEDSQNVFIPITSKWENEFTSLKKEGNFDIFLFQLIPQFKIENYVNEKENENLIVKYVEPKEISMTLEEGRKTSLANMQESQISLKMEMMIDENLHFELAGAEYLWERIQTWAASLNEEHLDEYYYFDTPLVNAISSISVLFHHENVWIENHPEYLVWIKDFFYRLINMQAQRKDLINSFGSILDWSVKLTPLAIKMWHRTPEEKVLREIIAGIIILFSEETTKAFFENASIYFELNAPVFIQTQNLFLLYSAEESETYRQRNFDPELLKPIRVKYILDFSDNKISSSKLEWSENINQRKILLLLKLLPEFRTISNSGQKEYVYFLLQQGLDQTMSNLKKNDDDNKYIEDFDRYVLIKIAECLPFLEEKDKPDVMWLCILQFGYLAGKAMELFCDSFFKSHLNNEDNYHVFIPLFKKMVNYVLTSSTWETKIAFTRHDDFRDCVIGLSPSITHIWDTDRSLFLKETFLFYSGWIKRNKYNPHTISKLLKFMITKSGETLLKESLLAVKTFFLNALEKSRQEPPPGRVYVGHNDLDDRLASTLSFLWENKKDIITTNSELLGDYRELVQYLIAMENIVGIEIHQRLLI